MQNARRCIANPTGVRSAQASNRSPLAPLALSPSFPRRFLAKEQRPQPICEIEASGVRDNATGPSPKEHPNPQTIPGNPRRRMRSSAFKGKYSISTVLRIALPAHCSWARSDPRCSPPPQHSRLLARTCLQTPPRPPRWTAAGS